MKFIPAILTLIILCVLALITIARCIKDKRKEKLK
jgi:hypothetical protein